MTFNGVCDSLTGLRPFYQEIKTKYVKVYIKSSDGDISAEVDIEELTSKITKEVRASVEKEHNESHEKVIVPTIPRWVWYLLAYSGLLTLWVFKKPIFSLITKIKI